VEVRTLSDVLASLDEAGCYEGLPFMPEMAQFCGKRYRIGAVAHKTCDTVHNTGGRRLQNAVHLEGLRCDGSAHGGCGAACYLIWKEAWLRPIDPRTGQTAPSPSAVPPNKTRAVTDSTQSYIDGEIRYHCQATRLYDATEALPWWDIRQYVFDVATRNHSVWHVARVVFLGAIRGALRRVPRGYRVMKWISDRLHLWLTGRPTPQVVGKIDRGSPTPQGRLDLHPGELVRIKALAEIEKTLDASARNRGLRFDAEEMAPYCGRTVRVLDRVMKIIHETTGKMIDMKEPCIVLEGVFCRAENASCRLNCPRAIRSYWREVWLERATHDAQVRVDPAMSPPVVHQLEGSTTRPEPQRVG